MESNFVKQLESFVIGDCEEVENFAVFPVYADEKGETFLTLDEAMKKELIKVSEISDSGSVPILRVINFSKQYVVIFMGEMLVGAKQNRVVNTTIIIKPLSEIEIPVSCVEEGRWSYEEKHFSDFDAFAFNDLRKEIVRDVNMSRRTTGKAYAQQGKVWDMVNLKLCDLKVDSPTHSLDEAFIENRLNSEKFLANFKAHRNQIGAFIIVNSEFQIFETCSSPKAFKGMYPKLMKSVYLDNLNKHMKKPGKKKSAGKVLSQTLNELKKAQISVFKGIGEGTDLQIEGKSILGSGVELNNKLLHLTVFSSRENKRSGRRRWRY